MYGQKRKNNSTILDRDRDGNTALHLAARQPSLPLLQLLLSHRADPNIPNNFGKFPLHITVQNNQLDMVQALLAGGVDIEARDLVSTNIVMIFISAKVTKQVKVCTGVAQH